MLAYLFFYVKGVWSAILKTATGAGLGSPGAGTQQAPAVYQPPYERHRHCRHHHKRGNSQRQRGAANPQLLRHRAASPLLLHHSGLPSAPISRQQSAQPPARNGVNNVRRGDWPSNIPRTCLSWQSPSPMEFAGQHRHTPTDPKDCGLSLIAIPGQRTRFRWQPNILRPRCRWL